MKTIAIINYCSYHNAFIDKCIEEVKKVTDNVIVVSSDSFFNGEKDFERKTFDNCVNMTVYYHDLLKARYWHNYCRFVGYQYAKENFGFNSVFFIDSDEILEGELTAEWLKNEAVIGQNYKLACFWYYRDTCYRADQIEEGAVLISKESLESPEMNWFGGREREDYCKDWNYKTGYNNHVLNHHYSWAGTKEMLLQKVRSWGHNEDNIDWVEIVENEFKHEFVNCPFKDYTFTKIKPFVNFTFNEDRLNDTNKEQTDKA